MATIKTDEYAGRKATTTRHAGEVYQKVISYTPSANIASGDILLVAQLEEGEQCLDWQVGNSTTALVGTLGVMNAGLTAVATAWKAGVAAYQRADSAVQWFDVTARTLGFVATASQTGAGTLTFVLSCRRI
jgi:hypothetical protein